MTNTTTKEATNAVAGQDADHIGGTDWNQLVQVVKGSHSTERIQSTSVEPVVVTKTGNYTATSSDDIILVDASSGAITITLPAPTSSIKENLVIKKIDNSLSNLVTVTTPSGNIDGVTSYYLDLRGETLWLASDGSNWRIIRAKSTSFHSYCPKGSTLNRWLSSNVNAVALGTSTLVANTLYATPLIIDKVMTFDQIAINVTTLGASSSVRAGIYYDNGNLYPNTLVSGSDVAAYSTATTGVKTNTFASPITIPQGLYWLACVCNATAPIIRGHSVNGLPAILGLDSGLGTTPGIAWSVAFTFAALPSTFTAGGTISTTIAPGIFLRTTG